MTTTVDIPTIANAEQKASTDVPTFPGASASGEGSGLRVPLFVPTRQLYYWTKEWQDGEREALADVEAGRTRQFVSGSDAASWLLRDED
jgi:hypothetical protein